MGKSLSQNFKAGLTFTGLISKDLFHSKVFPLSDSGVHLEHALNWLIRAHDRGDDDGVSYGYSIKGGWKESYVETTGYIITTFFNLAQELERPDLSDRAVRMARWLCTRQLQDGSFTNLRFSRDSGIVFDTGQDLFGLVRASRECPEEAFSQAANRAADWLVKVADQQLQWTRSTHLGIQHVYNTRVAWALLQANALWPSDQRESVARANLDFALEQETNGWFDQCAFTTGASPFTHTIAYAIRGLWESSQLLQESHYADAALRAAAAVASKVRNDGFLAGQFDIQGNEAASYVCLTGNCQMAIVWAKMFNATGNELYKEAAVKALRYVTSRQDIQTSNPDIRGAIKGSYPIWGKYSPLAYPNWATKFFIDALSSCKTWL